MSDVSKFIFIVAVIVGLIWFLRASWAGSIRWIERQSLALNLRGWQQRFWRGAARLVGPLSPILFFLFAPHTNKKKRPSDWFPTPPGPISDDAVTDSGEKTLPPESNLCLLVIESRTPRGTALGQRYCLVEGTNAIGREPTPEPFVEPIVVEGDDAISRNHLYLEMEDNGRCQVEDRGSSYGTRLNGQRLEPHQAVSLKIGDRLRLGNTTLQLSDEVDSSPHTRMQQRMPKLQLRLMSGQDAGKTWPVESEPFFIGRNGACHWRLADNKVSRRHAEVRREGNQVRIKDLNSSHGLYINGHKYQSRVLEPGDVIKLGDTEIKFEKGDA